MLIATGHNFLSQFVKNFLSLGKGTHSFAQIMLKSVENNTKVAGQFADKYKTDKRLAGLKN
jgi:hypothetical protein